MRSLVRFNCALQMSTEESASKEKNIASMAKRENSKQDNGKGSHGRHGSLFIPTSNGGDAFI